LNSKPTVFQVTQEEFLRACLAHEKISTMLALRIIDVFIADTAAAAAAKNAAQ
jgi:hypothetical protein